MQLELEASIFRSVMAWQIHIRRDVDGELTATDYMSVIIDDVASFLLTHSHFPNLTSARTLSSSSTTSSGARTVRPNTLQPSEPLM